jgi:aspartyl-tRNA(Asn)/glutamyl-tRNA(Gln) amidotransferase subunit C
MNLEDIKKLASLARLHMTEGEMSEIAKDFDSILAYVGQVQEISKDSKSKEYTEDTYMVKNICRDDIVTNNSGEYTEKILANSPANQDGYLKVKKIL